MTDRNGVVKGLRDQECPYVPVIDEVQDALNINHKERLQKIKLPNGTEFNATIWYTGTPEEFLNHAKQALHACERMGYFEEYKKALKDMGTAVRKQNHKTGVTAILAVLTAGRSGRHSSKKVSVKKTIRVLLDSGSDGDLLFHRKGTLTIWGLDSGVIHTYCSVRTLLLSSTYVTYRQPELFSPKRTDRKKP